MVKTFGRKMKSNVVVREANSRMKGYYAQWFYEHPFPRYMDPIEPILGIDDQLSEGEDGDDEGGLERGRER